MITSQKNKSEGGFEQGEYQVKAKSKNYTVVYKNENLVLLKDSKVLVTCPDSISLLDLKSFEEINNFEDNIGKNVAILVLELPYKQKLL